MTRWEREELSEGGKESSGVPQAQSNSPCVPLNFLAVAYFVKSATFLHKKHFSMYHLYLYHTPLHAWVLKLFDYSVFL